MEGGGEREGAAVEHVLADVAGGQRVQRAKTLGAWEGDGADVDHGALTDPVPGREPGAHGQARRCPRVVTGEPVVEQPQGDADAAGDRRRRGVRGLGLGPVQGGCRGGGVSDGGRCDRSTRRVDREFAGRSDRGEQGHVLPLDRGLRRRLKRLQVGHSSGPARSMPSGPGLSPRPRC